MKLQLIPFLLIAVAHSQTPAPPQSVEFRIENRNRLLDFAAHNDRRYNFEISYDLHDWSQHYLSPLKKRNSPVELGWIDEYSPQSEFYRFSVLPWKFQAIETSVAINQFDAVGDLAIDMLPDGKRAFVFQNRTTDRLYYGESLSDGSPSPIVLIDFHVTNDSSDSGFTNISFAASQDGSRYMVCIDLQSEELVCFRRSASGTKWSRSVVASGLSAPFWAFPEFSISPSGRLGIVYAGNDGSYFSWADSKSPLVWKNLKISNLKPNSASGNGLVFNSANIALTLFGDAFRINPATSVVKKITLPQGIQGRRGQDGSLIAATNSVWSGISYGSISRSTDDGATWFEITVELPGSDFDAIDSVDCNSKGLISFLSGDKLFRQTTPGSSFEISPFPPIGTMVSDKEDKLHMLVLELDGELSLASED